MQQQQCVRIGRRVPRPWVLCVNDWYMQRQPLARGCMRLTTSPVSAATIGRIAGSIIGIIVVCCGCCCRAYRKNRTNRRRHVTSTSSSAPDQPPVTGSSSAAVVNPLHVYSSSCRCTRPGVPGGCWLPCIPLPLSTPTPFYALPGNGTLPPPPPPGHLPSLSKTPGGGDVVVVSTTTSPPAACRPRRAPWRPVVYSKDGSQVQCGLCGKFTDNPTGSTRPATGVHVWCRHCNKRAV